MVVRRLFLAAAVLLALFVVSAVTLAVLWRPAAIKHRVEQALSDHLHLDATIGELSLGLVPALRLSGSDFALRIPSRPDLPPFVAIEHFSVDLSPIELLRRHIGVVHVGGLKITIPPSGQRGGVAGAHPSSNSKILVDRLDAHDSQLVILRRKPGHLPLVFDIHELHVSDLGFDRPMKFDAALTNPVPTGEVVSTGTVGPWATEPADLPLAGKYTFTRADLDTIKGIGGTLRSEGTYEGIIENLHVVGHTSTPDFNLDMGGKPVPLETSFNVRVEAQNGTTHLDEVEAHLFGTVIHAKGDVVNLPGPAGFDITLSATVAKGRIEDLLRLAVDSPRPLLEGTVGLSCRVLLPAGHVSVRERLQLTGQFDLDRTTMTNPAAELKIKELSQRGQGKSKDEGTDERVMTSLSGHFRLRRGVLSLPDLSFQVPGATIALDGTYALATGQLDFIGELRMQASMSRVVGGIKSIFLRPFDFFFRRDGAGTVVPIKITGSREHPEFGVRVGAALTRGK